MANCPYEAHRTFWRVKDGKKRGPWTCATCHPIPEGYPHEIEKEERDRG